MIDKAIQFLTDELNDYFRLTLSLSEDHAIASPIANGSMPAVQNKVVLTLINIKQDALLKNEPVYRMNATSLVQTTAPLHISLQLLVSANFDDYTEALKFISATMKFFQGKSVFNQSNSPALPTAVDSLLLDLENISLQDLNAIWTMHGGGYLPSVIYKLRMLTV